MSFVLQAEPGKLLCTTATLIDCWELHLEHGQATTWRWGSALSTNLAALYYSYDMSLLQDHTGAAAEPLALLRTGRARLRLQHQAKVNMYSGQTCDGNNLIMHNKPLLILSSGES